MAVVQLHTPLLIVSHILVVVVSKALEDPAISPRHLDAHAAPAICVNSHLKGEGTDEHGGEKHGVSSKDGASRASVGEVVKGAQDG